MGITDELREYALGWDERNRVRRDLTAIANRIDAEHERLMQEQPFTIDMVPMTDERMAEHGWVRLPKDADGVPIRIGDRVMHKSLVKPVVVIGVGNDDFFYQSGAGFIWFFHAHEVHHHHKPTVEDVLEELLREYDRDDSELTDGEIIERFAAKLRLAGDEG